MGFFNRNRTKEKGIFTDPRDGKFYTTTKIGKQVWMAVNLAFEIPGKECQADVEWDNKTYDQWCYYENNKLEYRKYGILYQWEAAKAACPAGWHLPTDEEWEKLAAFIARKHGYSKDNDWERVGNHLNSTSGWEDDVVSNFALDNYGFSALPGGYRDYHGSFGDAGHGGIWWSATPSDSSSAWNRGLYFTNEGVSRSDFYRSFGYAVRCVKDHK